MTTYNIELTDIRGVGETTAGKIRNRLIDYVDEGEPVINALHLLRDPHGPAARDLRDKGVGSDVIGHLVAVGEAVHYSGGDRVQAKHLTGDLTDDAVFGSSFVDITEDEPDPEPQENEEKPPLYGESDVSEALEAVRDEYGDGYPEWGRFIADLSRFAAEQDYSVDLNEPDHAFPVVRYRKFAAVDIMGDEAWGHGETAALVEFAETL